MNPSRRRAPLLLAGSLTAALALALSACSSGDSPSASSSSGSSSSGSVAPVSGGAAHVDVTVENRGGKDVCTLSHTSAKAGPVTFSVTNTSSTAITEVELLADERILGEKENLAPGLPAVSFTSTLSGGTYKVYCPGAAAEQQTFTVTGKATQATGDASTLLADGAKQYAGYVDDNVAAMVTATQDLADAVNSGDLGASQAAYAAARPFYERIESDVDGFVKPGGSATDNATNLDYLIDMRESNLDPAVGWHGFHAVERDLFGAQQITDSTKATVAELVTNVNDLATLAKGLEYKPEDLANGAADLLEEVQSEKIKGEEEAFSHIDLVDFAANVEGAQQAFANLEPGLKKINPTLVDQVNQQFATVNAALDQLRQPGELGGYERWTPDARASQAAGLSQKVQALQDPLSTIAEKVATAS